MTSMARPRLGAPFDIALPSGARITVRATIDRPLPRDLPAAIERGVVTSDTDLFALPLADANVIEAVVAAMRAIDAPPTELVCRNCEASIALDGARALPVGPLLEPLGDPELDPPVDREEWHAFDAPIAVARRGSARRFRLARRTLRDRIELEKHLQGALDVAPPLIRALGINALADGETIVVKSPIAIARALDALDDDAFGVAWDAICRAYDRQHWPPRLLAPALCPECGARHDVEVVRRPLDWAPPRGEHADDTFPSLDVFSERVATITSDVFRELGLDDPRGLQVVVDGGVPACDDGGEPLLGSYAPNLAADGDVLGPSSQFVITLYFRGFKSQFEDQPYDVDAEIRETIEHELEHHIGFLDGDDPLDDEERAAIATEHRRLVGGTEATDLAAGAGWLASDFARFLRTSWPLWVAVLFALLLLLASDR
jgi:hypothetical protein